MKKIKTLRMSKENDIVELILEDHRDLKDLIKILKNPKRDIMEKRQAFEEFAPLLITHSKPEEQTLYAEIRKDQNLRMEGMEGVVEHMLADQLLMEVRNTHNDDEAWAAKAKVLAELVERHIDEEERDLLPNFKKNTEARERQVLGNRFLELKVNCFDQDEENMYNDSIVEIERSLYM